MLRTDRRSGPTTRPAFANGKKICRLRHPNFYILFIYFFDAYAIKTAFIAQECI